MCLAVIFVSKYICMKWIKQRKCGKSGVSMEIDLLAHNSNVVGLNKALTSDSVVRPSTTTTLNDVNQGLSLNDTSNPNNISASKKKLGH